MSSQRDLRSGYTLALAQSGELMTATLSSGGSGFPVVAAPVREDGTSAFTPQLSVTDSGVTLTLDAAFTINSLRVGELTGTITEVYRVPNVSGEGRLTQDIVATTRTSTTTLNGSGNDGVSKIPSPAEVGAGQVAHRSNRRESANRRPP